MRRLFIVALALFLFYDTLNAQVPNKPWSVSGGIGALNYSGDLSWKFTNIKETQPGYTISFERTLSPTISLRLQYLQGSLTGNDRSEYFIRNNAQVLNASYGRSLNFSTDFYDVNMAAVFYLNNGRTISEEAVVAPYFITGFGFGKFRVFGDLLDPEGEQYHYWSDLTIRDEDENGPNSGDAMIISQDGNFETNLSDLNIEENYSQTKIQIPVGIGLKFRLSEKLSLRLESQYTYTFTDYLDDTGNGNLRDYEDEFTAYAANPAGNINDQRGNQKNKLNDAYLFTNLSFAYNFGGNRKSRFKGLKVQPIIYSPHDAAVLINESINDPTIVESNSLKNDDMELRDNENITITSPTIQAIPDKVDKLSIVIPDSSSPQTKYIIYAETAIFESIYYGNKDALITGPDEALRDSSGNKNADVVTSLDIGQFTDTINLPDSTILMMDSFIYKVKDHKDSLIITGQNDLIMDTVPPSIHSSDSTINAIDIEVADSLKQTELASLNSATITPDPVFIVQTDSMLISLKSKDSITPQVKSDSTVLINSKSVVSIVDSLKSEDQQQDTSLVVIKTQLHRIQLSVGQFETILLDVAKQLEILNRTTKDTVKTIFLPDTIKKQGGLPDESLILNEIDNLKGEVANINLLLTKKETQNNKGSNMKNGANYDSLILNVNRDLKLMQQELSTELEKVQTAILGIDSSVKGDIVAEPPKSVETVYVPVYEDMPRERYSVNQSFNDDDRLLDNVGLTIETELPRRPKKSDDDETIELLNVILARLDSLEKQELVPVELTNMDTTSLPDSITYLTEYIRSLEENLNKVTADYLALSETMKSSSLKPEISEEPVLPTEPVIPTEPVKTEVSEKTTALPITRVFFKSNQKEVDPVYSAKLNRVADYMIGTPEVRAEIRGYADPSGNAEYNLKLSRIRAENVRNYLIMQYDVEPERIVVLPMGEELPGTNSAEFSRRVEIQVK